MIRNMSIGQRLAIGFGVVIALLVLLAGLSYMRIASLNKEMDTLVKVRYANTVAANHVKEDVSEATRSMLNVLIMTDPDQIKKELANTEARSASATAQVAELAKSTGTIVAMDETTQQNAALVEEAAAAAASMQEQAQRLARAVSVFKLQTASPDAQAQTPGGPQLARSNQALATA